jgi:hypothetical protein
VRPLALGPRGLSTSMVRGQPVLRNDIAKDGPLPIRYSLLARSASRRIGNVVIRDELIPGFGIDRIAPNRQFQRRRSIDVR